MSGRAKAEYISHALSELRYLLENERFTSLALPRLATGAGGMDWHEVRPLIEHPADAAVLAWDYLEGNGNTHTYVWLPDWDFVVIMKDGKIFKNIA